MKHTLLVFLALIFSFHLLGSQDPIESLLQKMTLQEKIGQMVQINKIKFEEDPKIISKHFIGSILSGGGDTPKPNRAESWAQLVTKFNRNHKKLD